MLQSQINLGADHPGFLEKGVTYIKVWGFVLLILSHFSSPVTT